MGGRSMKIAVAAAMFEEIAPFREHYQAKRLVERGKTIIEELFFSEFETTLFIVETGIGKANAAAAASLLCETYHPDLIINTGSAGGFAEQLSIGDVVFATSLTYSDVDATGFDYVYGQVPQMPSHYFVENVAAYFDWLSPTTNYNLHRGLIVTADSFMSEKKLVETIKQRFPGVLASDMESTAITQVAHFYEIPVLNIRGISDIAGQNAADSFDQNIDIAAIHAFEQTKKLVDELIVNGITNR